MSHSVLIISNSNLFTSLSSLFLGGNYLCHTLNVRYYNEELNRSHHFIQQLKEIHFNYLYNMGRIETKHAFDYNKTLIRMEQAIENVHPRVIFFEIKTFEKNELVLLEYIKENYDIPLITFLPPEKKHQNIRSLLKKIGIKDIITQYDKDTFLAFAERMAAWN